MNSKERVLRCINFEETDRVPIDFVAVPDVIQKLFNHFGIRSYDELLDRLNVDFRYVGPREVVYEKNLYKGPRLKTYSDGSWEDIWGVRRKKVQTKTGEYQAEVYNPLKDVTSIDDIANYNWPSPDWYDYSTVYDECCRYRDYAVVGGAWSAFFGDSFRLFGMENFFIKMILEPEIVKAAIEKVVQFYLAVNIRIFEAAKGLMDIFYMGNDFGTQNGLFMNRDLWVSFFKPCLTRFADLAKSYGLKVMAHSCGGIAELIPDFIEAGVDILDPVQVNARGMDLKTLKENFGNKITFHGGIDTQNLLPFGSRDDVRNKVKDTIDLMKKNGAYILCPDQHLQTDVPIENIITLYKTAIEFG